MTHTAKNYGKQQTGQSEIFPQYQIRSLVEPSLIVWHTARIKLR